MRYMIDIKFNNKPGIYKITYASIEFGINKNRISGCLKGRFKNGGGYIWKYEGKNQNSLLP